MWNMPRLVRYYKTDPVLSADNAISRTCERQGQRAALLVHEGLQALFGFVLDQPLES